MIARGMNAIGICLETSRQALEAVLGCMQSGMSVCMLSMRWPAALIDRTLEGLGIAHVVTTRTDLKTGSVHPSFCHTAGINPEILRHLHRSAVTIMHTTGSSAEPKAVVHTLNNHLFSAKKAISRLNLQSTDRWLLSLPLWHVSGMSIVFRCLTAGAEFIIPKPEISLMEALSAYRITHVSMVSTQLVQVLDTSPPASLRAAIVGGGPVSHGVLERAIKNGWPIRTTYGMTETSSMITLSDPEFVPGSSGHALDENELKIAPDGEILIRSPAVCAGYLHKGEIQSIVDEDGWFSTGDLGKLHPTEGLYVLGRKDNVYISGGENISPEEIERVLCEFSGVQDAIVVPVPDDKFGQRSVAFVQASSDFEGLKSFLAANLPKFKIPICYPWPEHTLSGTIKPDRTSFKELAIQLKTE